MKKLLSILLAVLLCFSACSVVAFAAGEDIVAAVVPAKTEVSRGDTFNVAVNLNANKGFVTLGLLIDYDADVFEVVCPDHYEGDPCYPVIDQLDKVNNVSNIAANSETHDVNPYGINWAYGTAKKNVTNTGTIATLQFKVKDSAKIGKTEISISVKEAADVDSNKPTTAGGKTEINVKCANHTKDAGTVTTPATCTADGVKTYKCKDCGAAMSTEKVTKLGHDWGDWQGTADAKCGTQGEETRVCKNDASHTETRKTNALEHLWDAGTVTKQPTCTEKGVKTFKCTRTECTGSKTEDIKALGHKYGDWSVTTEPKCEVDGEETRVCANDASHKETRAVDAIGHDFDYDNPNVTKEPTCTEEGEEEYACLNGCGEVETDVIPADGHTVEWTINKEATTTEEGERAGTCEVCGEEITEAIPKLTTTIDGDKLNVIIIDNATGDVTEGSSDGIKVESADDEPFSGYIEGDIMVVYPSEDDDVETVDGKMTAVAYVIALYNSDTIEELDMDKLVTITIPVSEAIASAYENLVLVGMDEEGEDIIIEDAVYADGAFVVTGKYGDLAALAIAGDKIVEEDDDNNAIIDDGENGSDDNDESTSPATGDTAAIAFAIVMLSVAGAVLVFTSKKARA